MKVLFKSFDSKMASREKIFRVGSEFATKIGTDRLINITHSEDRDNIVITVWYWGEEEEKPKPKSNSGMVAALPPETGAPLAAPAPPSVTEAPVTEFIRRPPLVTSDDSGPSLNRAGEQPPKSDDDAIWDRLTGS